MLRSGLLAVLVLALGLVPVWAHPGFGDDHPHNESEVITPPQPVYPSFALFFGLNGYCEVGFDLQNYTSVRVTSVSCTSKGFCFAAERAVKAASFRVIDVPGAPNPGERKNIVYPMVFKMHGSKKEPAPSEATPLKPCVEYPVS
jgi:hypothetical protein